MDASDLVLVDTSSEGKGPRANIVKAKFPEPDAEDLDDSESAGLPIIAVKEFKLNDEANRQAVVCLLRLFIKFMLSLTHHL